MTSNALEAKINKIRQQNEEIRRRHQEVEEDKKNAAKLNALVQMVPSSDWPERKEPPEFSNLPKTKSKAAKEKHEYTMQAHPAEGKKIHSFAHGEGPPPDPKYNFLADSEREEPGTEYVKEPSGNKSHNKVMRGNFKAKRGGRENHMQKDNKVYKGNYRDESQPGYDAWRAERNRIDEDRIRRQRTSEGNWRREWDNDKMRIIDDVAKKATRSTLGDFAKKDHKDSDRRYHSNNNEYISHSRGGSRPHRGTSKNFYGNYDNRSHNMNDQHRNNATMPVKPPLSPTSEERTVIATDSSLKVTVNQGNTPKGPVMSVKVNSPSIAGTGRVGPRQRTRVTYSHSDADAPVPESESFNRQKSFEDKSKGTYFNNPKSPNVKRTHSQKKKEGEAKYPYQKKEIWREEGDANSPRYHENEFRTYTPRNIQKSQPIKSPKTIRRDIIPVEQNPSGDSSSETKIQCSSIDSAKHEREFVTEKNAMFEVSDLFDQIEPSNGESDIKDEYSIKVSGMEVEQVPISLPESAETGAENFEKVTKDVKDVINPDENECPQTEDQEGTPIASNTGEKVQENSMSSEAVVSSTMEPVANELEANLEPVINESGVNVEPVTNESGANVDPLEEFIPKVETVSAESVVKSASTDSASIELALVESASIELAPVESASIELASVELAPIELISSESIPKVESVSAESVPTVESASIELASVELAPIELISSDSIPKVESVSAELVPTVESASVQSVSGESNQKQDFTESIPTVESTPAEPAATGEPVSIKVPKLEPISVDSVPKVESISVNSEPKEELLPTESVPTMGSIPAKLVPNVEAIPAESVAKVAPAPAESVAKEESIATETVAKVESLPTESVTKVEPVPTESVLKVEPVLIESVPKVDPVPAELVLKVEPVLIESAPKVDPIPTESVLTEEPGPAEFVSKVKAVTTESVPKVELVPAESLPKVESVPAESVPKVEPIPAESAPNADSAPDESVQGKPVPKIEPVVIESVPTAQSVPVELVSAVEPVAAESVPKVESTPAGPVLIKSNNEYKAPTAAAAAASDKQDHQLQISEQDVKDDCDTVKDEILENRMTLSTKNEPTSSSEAEANSVINTKNQVVCSDESADKQTLLANAEVVNKIDKNDERSSTNTPETSPGNAQNGSTVENKEVGPLEDDVRVEL